jgi:hypothetical protein
MHVLVSSDVRGSAVARTKSRTKRGLFVGGIAPLLLVTLSGCVGKHFAIFGTNGAMNPSIQASGHGNDWQMSARGSMFKVLASGASK